MLTRLLVIGLIIALISSNFSRFFIYAGFEANRSYIAKELCENKSKPWMHCNGRCYLMKKVKAAEEKEKKQEAKDNLSRIEVSLFQEPFTLSFSQPVILEARLSLVSRYNYQSTSQHTDSIFRPPKQIA